MKVVFLKGTTRGKESPPEYVYYSQDYETDSIFKIVNSCQDIPTTFREAIGAQDSEHWRKAMDEEIISLKENNTFTFVKLPENKNLVGEGGSSTSRSQQKATDHLKPDTLLKGIVKQKELTIMKPLPPLQTWHLLEC